MTFPESILHCADFEDISALPGVSLRIKYATTDNFTGRELYGDFARAFLHKDAAEKFRTALALLAESRPGWAFLVFDALRPRSVQRLMWDEVKDGPRRPYVADAGIGSPHNFGMALDLGLLDGRGEAADMGTGFDDFTALSEPRLEEAFLREGRLTAAQRDNRLILRKALTGAGFLQHPREWWHFNALPEDEIRAKYRIVE
jgi:zinc D-Ala-D-Ala dipeptidase